jgi:integrase
LRASFFYLIFVQKNMAEVNFYLKGRASKKTITMYFSYGGSSRLMMTTKIRVSTEEWNTNKQRVLSNASGVNFKAANTKLDTIRSRILESYSNLLRDNKVINNDTLLAEMNKFDENNKQEQTDVIGFINEIINEREKSNSYSIQTIKSYKSVRNQLLIFSGNKKILFSDIDKKFWQRFKEYFSAKDLGDNTIAKYFRILKTILHVAINRGLVTSDSLNMTTNDMNLKPRPMKPIFLTDEELDRIFDYDFSTNKRLERVRDSFYIACYTGLRYSDLVTLSANHIENQKYLNLFTKKTGAGVLVPISKNILSIFQRYNGKLPRVITNQNMNKYLKEIGEKCGIDTLVNVVKYTGKTKKETIKKKYELICTHTARRSFVTNLYLAVQRDNQKGVSIANIMLLTGHKTEKEFFKYLCIDVSQNAEMMAELDFFK